ncbi:MAG: hypothetical protein P4L71_13170 [Acetobacteraceae bacterium]|nr:hypothetical protein [Acetobacteraceae bacterium]
MNEDLVAIAVRLADVLQRENTALAALDLARAASMVAEKRFAADAFALAQGVAGALDDQPKVVDVATRLRDLADENRLLLERAIAVQSRVIGVIARAMPPSTTPRYAATGTLTRSARPVAFTLSARA